MFRAVKDLCAVDFTELKLPISKAEATKILIKLGFVETSTSLREIANLAIGNKYCKTAKLSEAPIHFNCSGLTKWLYGQIGIWIPRRCIQQFMFGTHIDREEARIGDLVFMEGFTPYYLDNPENGMSHVSMILDKNTVIHAASRALGRGVFTSPISAVIEAPDFRGIRRIVDNIEELVIFRAPPEQEVETSDDIKWIVYQNL